MNPIQSLVRITTIFIITGLSVWAVSSQGWVVMGLVGAFFAAIQVTLFVLEVRRLPNRDIEEGEQ